MRGYRTTNGTCASSCQDNSREFRCARAGLDFSSEPTYKYGVCVQGSCNCTTVVGTEIKDGEEVTIFKFGNARCPSTCADVPNGKLKCVQGRLVGPNYGYEECFSQSCNSNSGGAPASQTNHGITYPSIPPEYQVDRQTENNGTFATFRPLGKETLIERCTGTCTVSWLNGPSNSTQVNRGTLFTAYTDDEGATSSGNTCAAKLSLLYCDCDGVIQGSLIQNSYYYLCRQRIN